MNVNLSNINLSRLRLGGINLSEIKLGMPSGKGTGGEEAFDPASFNEAWTVTGKTNDDEDRATVKNLTGNGNDLVLSNFAFAGDSGYGLYSENFNDKSWYKIDDRIGSSTTSSSIFISSIKNTSAVQILKYLSSGKVIPSMNIKISGMTDGVILDYRTSKTILSSITTNGIYTLPSYTMDQTDQYYGFKFNKVQESCNIIIEQIPDYEEYLVTDGVDDRIVSNNFELGKDWTIIGDWVLLDDKNVNAGIMKGDSLFIYNRQSGLVILINRTIGEVDLNTKSLKGISSDGRVYLNDWEEIKTNTNGQTVVSSTNPLIIGASGNSYTKIAFKNLAIYNGKVLTKDQCIKAYNYLQTLKEK